MTESIDTSIAVCAELQEGVLERNISINLLVVGGGSNGIHVCNLKDSMF